MPLVTQGELIGTLNLGPRLSEQDYSSDDRRLLGTLAAQAAPAIRVAQLVREQAAEAAERERYEQELKVAQLIQQQFLPRELPKLPEWQIAAYYGPARVVGGDFYDFIDLGEGRIGVVVGDVTDKGVPAALVMARTHSILRAEAPRLIEPGLVLARANELLAPEMPARMFVTCLYGVLEPDDGPLRVRERGPQPALRAHRRRRHRAAGDGPPARPDARASPTRRPRASSARATRCCCTPTGWSSSTGPAARCSASRACASAMEGDDAGSQLLDRLLEELSAFTGSGLRAGGRHHAGDAPARRRRGRPRLERGPARGRADPRRSVADGAAEDASRCSAFTIEGAIGNERAAMQRVAEAVAPLGLEPARLERLKTAVAETVMNAIEYGSQGDPAVPVDVRVDADADTIRVRVTDRALSGPVPDAEMPDLDAKLEGRQKPRGWGLFLIRHMVDGMDVHAADGLQTVTLTLARDGR